MHITIILIKPVLHHLHGSTSTSTPTPTPVHLSICIYIYTCTSTSVHLHLHLHLYMYIYIYICNVRRYSVLHAPMAWLDLNPSGRILNRFSDDMSKVDTNLPFAWGSVFACVFNLLGTFVTVAVITKWLIISAIPIGYIYSQMMIKYLKASREIQRMQQMSISPVLTYMVEVSGGASVVNAFQAGDFFTRNNDGRVAHNSQMIFMTNAASAWFTVRVQVSVNLKFDFYTGAVCLVSCLIWSGVPHWTASSSALQSYSMTSLASHIAYLLTIQTNIYLLFNTLTYIHICMIYIYIQCLGAVILLFICLFAFSPLGGPSLGPSLIGLSISYGLAISDELMFSVMIISWLENSMVCPERILQVCVHMCVYSIFYI